MSTLYFQLKSEPLVLVHQLLLVEEFCRTIRVDYR